MKGIVLAGGTGTRLFPLTKITNKHLLPIYDKPMVYYPIQTLVEAGIRDIMIVTGGRNAGIFCACWATARSSGWGTSNYTYQEGEGGIAEALALAEHFADGDRICVILGDNIIEGSIREAVQTFEKQAAGARILLKQVPDAGRFGVAEIRDDRIVGIEEKPKQPEVELRRHRHLHVRPVGLRHDPDAGPFRARRARNHGRQQRLHRRRIAGVFVPGRLVDGRRHVRLPATGREPGGADASTAGRVLVDGGRGRSNDGAIARTGGIELLLPGCEKGIGSLIPAPDSPDLIAGVRVAPLRSWPDDRGYFLEVLRMARDAGGVPRRGNAGLGGARLSGRHQGLSLPPAPDRRWIPAQGMFQVALVDLRRGSPPSGRGTRCTWARLRPWQILSPRRRARLQDHRLSRPC